MGLFGAVWERLSARAATSQAQHMAPRMAVWMGSWQLLLLSQGQNRAQLLAEAQRHEGNANDNCLILNSDKYAHVNHSKRINVDMCSPYNRALQKGALPLLMSTLGRSWSTGSWLGTEKALRLTPPQISSSGDFPLNWIS